MHTSTPTPYGCYPIAPCDCKGIIVDCSFVQHSLGRSNRAEYHSLACSLCVIAVHLLFHSHKSQLQFAHKVIIPNELLADSLTTCAALLNLGD